MRRGRKRSAAKVAKIKLQSFVIKGERERKEEREREKKRE